MVFSYDKNGLLEKMISNENFDGEVKSSVAEFAYDTDKLIQYSETTLWEFSIQNGILINETYYDFENVEKDYRIKTSREAIEDGCINTYEDDVIITSYCPSNFEHALPYIYEHKIYEDGVLKRKATSKIEETAKGVFSVYGFVSALKEFKKTGEVIVGDSGRTEQSVMQSRNQNYILRFEYK